MDDLDRFVASLAIPADRKAVVLAELRDHVACAIRDGKDPDLGDLEVLRRSLEAVEPAFHTSRRSALARGVACGVLTAIAIDQVGWALYCTIGAAVALLAMVALAPPRWRELLRAELLAPKARGRVLRGIPIGPAMTYVMAIACTPFVVWVGMIVVRGFTGSLEIDIPPTVWMIAYGPFVAVLAERLRLRTAVA